MGTQPRAIGEVLREFSHAGITYHVGQIIPLEVANRAGCIQAVRPVAQRQPEHRAQP